MASVPLHAWMLLEHSHGIVLTVVMSAMVLWCLQCALGVLRRVAVRPATGCTRTRALRHLWVMAGVMAALHVALLTGIPSGGGGHHGTHGAGDGLAVDAAPAVASASPVGSGLGLDTGAPLMLAIVTLEVAVCFACAVALRTRPPRGSGMPSLADAR
ncbi:MAG: hypothetical protein QJR09_05495 [Micrococcus sp.]|nr:hypothetical protein [Micrococcus sp.]